MARAEEDSKDSSLVVNPMAGVLGMAAVLHAAGKQHGASHHDVKAAATLLEDRLVALAEVIPGVEAAAAQEAKARGEA